MDNQVIAAALSQLGNHAVGILLQGGKFFVAAQVVFFGKLCGLAAQIPIQGNQMLLDAAAFGGAQAALVEPGFQGNALIAQPLQGLLARTEFVLQSGLDALCLNGLLIHALGIDKSQLLYAVGNSVRCEQHRSGCRCHTGKIKLHYLLS